MTAAETMHAAAAAVRWHARGCRHCDDTLAVDRSHAGCPTGVRLELRWAGAWRAMVDQLSGRQ